MKTYFALIALLFVLTFVAYPLGVHALRHLKSLAYPIMFPYKHVLITGCGSQGLGRALVQEIYMRGAYITMVGGRDGDKLKALA